MTVESPPGPDAPPRPSIRIAYILVAFQRPESVLRLVRRLYAPDHVFFIHYDLRSGAAGFQRIAGELGGLPNVTLLQRRPCRWGSDGIVHAALEAIREQARQEYVWDFAIFLSEQDYPLRSDAHFRQRLAAAAGGSFMQWAAWPIPDWEQGRAIRRMENFHWQLPFPRWARSLGWPPMWQHLTLPWKRRVPGGLHPHFGSSYWCLHRSCLKYINDYAAAHPEYVRFFRHVHIPDECFFQTLLLNSPLAASVTPHPLTLVEWRPPWPAVFTRADLPRLQQSDCLLARKFDPAVDAQILDQLDALAAHSPAFQGQVSAPRRISPEGTIEIQAKPLERA